MKYVKMLGLAVVAAAALMAFIGASTASATVLCKTTQEVCAKEWDYPSGTEIHTVLKAGTKATLETDAENPSVLATCEESTLKGSTTNTGSDTETVDGKVEKANLTWGKCSTNVATVAGGLLEVHYGEKGDGVVTAKEVEVTVELFGVNCVYGAGAALSLGTLTEPASSTSDTVLDIKATPKKTSGSFLCPATATWTAEYTVTSPVPLYVSTKAEGQP